jgi:hypothetical protein
MNISVTGTRSGMTPYQRSVVKSTIEDLPIGEGFEDVVPDRCVQVHHGDCVGVDVEFAEMFQGLGGVVTVSHPPSKNDLRAFHESDIILDPMSYFARNRKIVELCDVLIVIPYQNKWCNDGGTWYTHDYAKKQDGVDVYVIWPNGGEGE